MVLRHAHTENGNIPGAGLLKRFRQRIGHAATNEPIPCPERQPIIEFFVDIEGQNAQSRIAFKAEFSALTVPTGIATFLPKSPWDLKVLSTEDVRTDKRVDYVFSTATPRELPDNIDDDTYMIESIKASQFTQIEWRSNETAPILSDHPLFDIISEGRPTAPELLEYAPIPGVTHHLLDLKIVAKNTTEALRDETQEHQSFMQENTSRILSVYFNHISTRY